MIAWKQLPGLSLNYRFPCIELCLAGEANVAKVDRIGMHDRSIDLCMHVDADHRTLSINSTSNRIIYNHYHLKAPIDRVI